MRKDSPVRTRHDGRVPALLVRHLEYLHSFLDTRRTRARRLDSLQLDDVRSADALNPDVDAAELVLDLVCHEGSYRGALECFSMEVLLVLLLEEEEDEE